MTFRFVGIAACLTAGLSACSGSPKARSDSTAVATSARTADSAGGAVATTVSGDTSKVKLPKNPTGKIPVLEYHVIGGEKNSLYTLTVASYKADLEDIYLAEKRLEDYRAGRVRTIPLKDVLKHGVED